MNALNMEMWGEIGDFFERVGEDSDCRVVVLSATGTNSTFKNLIKNKILVHIL